MRVILNIVLVILIIAIGYLLVNSIQEPIKFKAEKDRRTNMVMDKLLTIRKMQEFHRDIKEGAFANSFDSLAHVLRYGRFRNIRVNGDPDDPNFTGEITYDTTFVPAFDTIQALGINLDSLKYVPFGGGETFNIQADTMTYQSTLVHVVEVGTPIKTFMGPFADLKYTKYDNSYKPNNVMKFGDMNKPNLSGNW